MGFKNNIASTVNFVSTHKEDIKEYANLYMENKRLNAQIDHMNQQNALKLREIAERYTTQRLLIERVFGERSFALQAQYEALRKGLDTNNANIIIPALKSISDVICQNPVEQLAAYARALESTDDVLKLDF
jgi:hypothetical protein